MTDASAIERFVSDARTHPHADFYKNLWGEAASFDTLPRASREAFASCPLSHRSYKNEQGIVKVVHGSGGLFLSAWGFSDIAKEPYGIPSKRPLIYFANSHDTVEKSMWSYRNGMVPLAGEKNIAVTVLAARAFEVDSLISDPVAIGELLPYLQDRTEPLSSISLVSDVFRSEDLMRYRPFAETFRLVLSLPETGAFATAELSDDTRFTLLDNCRVEDEESIVLTKTASLITPIIRFDTGIPVSVISSR